MITYTKKVVITGV